MPAPKAKPLAQDDFRVSAEMRCAICTQLLDPSADMAMMEYTLRRAGSEQPTTYRMFACGSMHAAEALRRTAAAIEQKRMAVPAPGGDQWTRQHGVLVGTTA